MLNRLIKIIKGLKSPLKTPFYLFDELTLEQNFSVLGSLFDSAICQSSIAYSIKTNPLDIIASKAKDCGAWAEVVSLPELQLAEQIGFKEIIFNGIYKTDEELVYAANIGALIILDGHRQVNSICKISKKIKKTIKVGIRISSFPILKDNGARFGMPDNSKKLWKLAKNLVEINNIKLCCLHIHLGTNITDPRLYGKALKTLNDIKTLMERAGAFISYLDIGGGMPGCIDDKWKRMFCKEIKRFNDLTTDPNTTLIIEPGRSLVESSGFLVTRVIDIRPRLDKKGQDVIVDVGTNSVMGTNWGATHECISLSSSKRQNESEYRIVGFLCCSEDIIMESFTGNSLSIGDLILINGVGAYDFSTSYGFNKKVPHVYYLDKKDYLHLVC